MPNSKAGVACHLAALAAMITTFSSGAETNVMRRKRILLMATWFSLVPTLWAQSSEDFYREMRWRLVGPFRGGRTRAAAGVPQQPNVFYVGAVDGGVWKSDDFGRTWKPIFDQIDTGSVGAIAIAPSSPEIIYVASGEGLQRPDLSVGNGIYKTTDGGKTWSHLGPEDGQQIPALAVDPRNPDLVYAAVLGHPYGPNQQRGIYRSSDGGSSWTKVLYQDENTGGSDIEIDPKNPDVIYACLWQSRLGPFEDNNGFAGTQGGLFKSTDGGNTWRKLTRGLPENLVQINIDIAASQPSRLYATVSTTTPTSYASDKGMGFFRSDDGGESWTRITNDPRPAMKIGGGDLPVPKVDPQNPDVVYSASIVTVRSSDGGKTWESIRGAPGGDDYQNLWINPEHPNIILLVSDQGAIVTVNRGQTWSSWYNQPTAQLYHVSTTNSFPYKICGAQQESGSVCITSRGNDGQITFRDWHPVGVIEYGYVAPDPLNDDLVYGAGRSEVSRFHWTTGQVENVTPIPLRGSYRVDRTEPLVFSPVDPHILYYAANVVFATRDGGRSWQTISPDLTREHPGIPASVGNQATLNPKAEKQRGAVYALAPSFHQVSRIWAGTDDGRLWITSDGGKNWKDITPPAMIPWSKVTQISVSHFDDDTAYVSVSRFRIDDLRPYIYRTHDGGKSWQEITRGLPQKAPVNTVREDPVRKGLLFAGTETSVWVSFDDGDDWECLQFNLPHTSMRDLAIYENDLIVATHGRSFWVLDDITPLRQLGNDIRSVPQIATPQVLEPALAYRVRRSTNTDTPLPADEPAGTNPPQGAIIDYLLPSSIAGPVSLEILDERGHQVRSFGTSDSRTSQTKEQARELIPAYWWQEAKTLPSAPGMHRWIWDLRYPPPVSTEHEFPIAAVPQNTPRYPLGPTALPGRYTVGLTAAGHSYTTTLTVKMDPRVKISSQELEKKIELESLLCSALSESSKAVFEARSVRHQLGELRQRKSTLGDSIETLDRKVSLMLSPSQEPTSASPEPTLESANSDALNLYKEVEKVDAAPTSAENDAATRTAQRLKTALENWKGIKDKDLTDFNRQLTTTGLPQIQLNTYSEEPGRGESEP
jgi:photosystem II stability/assembly factor-like uncharacterized protein